MICGGWWWLGVSMCAGGACVGGCVCIQMGRVCVRLCVSVFQVLALIRTWVVSHPSSSHFSLWQSYLQGYKGILVTHSLFFFHTLTFTACWKINNLWISLLRDLWKPPLAEASLYVLAGKRITDLPCEASAARYAAKCYCELSQISHWQTLLTHKQTGRTKSHGGALWTLIPSPEKQFHLSVEPMHSCFLC